MIYFNIFINDYININKFKIFAVISSINLYIFFIKDYKSYVNFNNTNNTDLTNITYNSFTNNITDLNSLIYNLNLYSNYTKKTNIIFSDYIISKSCYDKNAYILFEYYLNNNIDIPYYIINKDSDFYKSLIKSNKTKNLILYTEKNEKNFYKDLFEYLKDAKIIINSYSLFFLQHVASNVSYIKYLRINHGIKYFKVFIAQNEIIKSLGDKTNVICSSPFEYKLLTKSSNYKKEYIHNASLVRYERFQFIKKNKSEKKCILVSFTYRYFDKYNFEKSDYKKNLGHLLNDEELLKYLYNKDINLVYIPHHEEIDLGKNYSQKLFKYAQIKNQSKLEHYIEQCSLLITDFSSICFDFMFQNKIVLFYEIDKNNENSYYQNNYRIKPNDTLFFGNYFSKKNLLIEKIKYYIDNNFEIGEKLKQNYESVFFIKKNIIIKLIEIINDIVERKR